MCVFVGCVEAGLTGAVLAERAGVGQPTVSKVENGRMVPSLDVLGRLCDGLGRFLRII
ncbi:helix-turn-helix domain-containing protein [Streptomyces antibioticus]|uniref:helix-turn-helix domain-containing protein n=1 Tax=Streptomyces antibioticus TaxID=1890 RepID=UPI00369F1E4A